MRISVVVLLAFCGGFIACQNYDLQDRISCPGCAAEGKAAAQYTPCTTCRIFVSGSTRGDMSGAGGCGGVGGGTAVCGVGATGIQRADHICQNDPARPNTTRTWKALLVDGVNRVACTNSFCTGGTGGRVDWVLKPNTSYVRANGVTQIWTTDANAVFVFGILINAIDTTIAYNAWTGLSADWLTNVDRCLDWSNATAGSNGRYGTSSLSDNQSVSGTIQTCDTVATNLYCVEQ